MNDENLKTDIEESAKKVKTSKEAAAVVQEMEKIIKSDKWSILWVAYQPGEILKNFKAKNKFINRVNQFGKRKSSMDFEIFIVRLPNNYSKLKKSLLSLYFLKNDFERN